MSKNILYLYNSKKDRLNEKRETSNFCIIKTAKSLTANCCCIVGRRIFYKCELINIVYYYTTIKSILRRILLVYRKQYDYTTGYYCKITVIVL